MSRLYLITGPAGVGKSTVSKEVALRRDKSVLIEGDDIYHQVVGGYQPAWKDGNHLEVFWKVCIESIRIYLINGYDVVFNYIINPKNLEEFKSEFQNYELKFVCLLTSEETLMARDLERPEDCQMGKRCLVLLNSFKNKGFDSKYILYTDNLSVDETVLALEQREEYLLKKE